MRLMRLVQLMALLICVLLSACGYDEPNTPDDPNNSSTTSNSVTIKADGSTSTGVVFSPIDETSFFLDYIKYEIVDSHLEIVGYDPIEIAEHVHPYAVVNYLGVTYITRVISEKAFQKCSKIKSISLPDGLVTIEDWAFDFCKGLTSVNFPDGLVTIGDWAFASCNGLTSVNFPDGLETIGVCAFYGCSGLTSVCFPDSLKTIWSAAFRSCDKLTSITILATFPPSCPYDHYQSYMFFYVFEDYTFSNCTLFVPKASMNLYKDANCWGNFSHIQGI